MSRLEKERGLAFGFVSSNENEVMVKKEESLSIMSVRGNVGKFVQPFFELFISFVFWFGTVWLCVNFVLTLACNASTAKLMR